MSLTANIKLRKVSYLQLLLGGFQDKAESLQEALISMRIFSFTRTSPVNTSISFSVLLSHRWSSIGGTWY